MNLRNRSCLLLSLTMFCGLAAVSCRKSRDERGGDAGQVPVISPELESNALAELPGAVYHSQASSPIHWQPWTKTTLERANAARRLVFGVIVLPQHSGFLKVLEDLESDPLMVEIVNNEYVPVLIDGDASRELGLLTADLCAEIKRPLELPLFVWLTHEGNPVAWIPVSASQSGGAVELFKQSHSMISQMWEDDIERPSPEESRGYVLRNSAADNGNRRIRFERRRTSIVMSEQPAVDVIQSLRQLVSLYDPYSRSFDEAGGLFPASSLDLLASAAVRPGVAPEIRERARETTRDLLEDLLSSAMFDPLDGGVFSSRRGRSWAFPSSVKDCPSQGRAATALIAGYRATGETRALETALGLISFAENSYRTPEGLFAVGLTGESEAEDWMWSVEEIETALGADDAAWWIEATRMNGLGNLPLEADPRREYFRQNTLGFAKSMTEIAASLSLAPEAFEPRFNGAKEKLLAIRNERIGEFPKDEHPHPGACFRMVSAYAAAFGVTGDDSYRERAVALLTRSREAFSDGPGLRVFSEETPASIGAGRAFHYALALQSALDVGAITSDDQWLTWAEDLATTAAEIFTGNGFVKECPDEAKLIDLPITDQMMLFDDSTAGLVSLAECRLAELQRPLVAGFSELAIPMPASAIDRPILHTDRLLAALIRHYRLTVVYGAELPASLKSAVERLPLRTVQRRMARSGDEVPADAVKVLLPDGQSVIAATPEALQEALLLSSGN